jgi:hypothetical protein
MKKIVIDLSEKPEFNLTLKLGRKVLASMVSDEFGQWLRVSREHLETCRIRTKIRYVRHGLASRFWHVKYQIAPWPSRTRKTSVLCPTECGARGLVFEKLRKKYGGKNVRLVR